MKKLTKKSLDELAKVMPVMNENAQRVFIGRGDGTSTDPYTYEEFNLFLASGYFPGGYVAFDGTSGIVNLPSSHVLPEAEVISYNPNDLTTTGVDSYDMMYRAGFAAGFQAGKSDSSWDDRAIVGYSGITAAAAGADFGDVNYEMIWYSQGLRDGLRRGREAGGY